MPAYCVTSQLVLLWFLLSHGNDFLSKSALSCAVNDALSRNGPICSSERLSDLFVLQRKKNYRDDFLYFVRFEIPDSSPSRCSLWRCGIVAASAAAGQVKGKEPFARRPCPFLLF